MARGFKIVLKITQGDLRAVATRLGIDPETVVVAPFTKDFNFKLPVTLRETSPTITILKMVLGERYMNFPESLREFMQQQDCDIKRYPPIPRYADIDYLTEEYDYAPFFDEKLAAVLKSYQIENREFINNYKGAHSDAVAWRASLGIFDAATFAIMHGWRPNKPFLNNKSFIEDRSINQDAITPSSIYLATRFYYLNSLDEGQLRLLIRRNTLNAGVAQVDNSDSRRTETSEMIAELMKPDPEIQLEPFEDQNGDTRVYLHLNGKGWRSYYDEDQEKRVWEEQDTFDLSRYDLSNPPVWAVDQESDRQIAISVMADEAIRQYIKYKSENALRGWPNHYSVLSSDEKFKLAYAGFDLDIERLNFKIGVYEDRRDSDYLRESNFNPNRDFQLGFNIMDPRVDRFGDPVVKFVRFHTPNMRPEAVYVAEFILNVDKINLGRNELSNVQTESITNQRNEETAQSQALCDQQKFSDYLVDSGIVEAAMREDATAMRQAREEAEEIYWDKKNEIKKEIARLKKEQEKRDVQAALLARPTNLGDIPIASAIGGALGNAAAAGAGLIGSGLASIGEQDGVLVITPEDLIKKANKIASKFEEWVDQLEEYQNNPGGEDPASLDSAGGRLEDATGRGIDLKIEADRLRAAANEFKQLAVFAFDTQKSISRRAPSGVEMSIYWRAVPKTAPDGKTQVFGPGVEAVSFTDSEKPKDPFDITTSISRTEGRNFDQVEGEIFQSNLRTMGYISQIHEMYQNMNFRAVTSDTLSKAPCLSFLSPTPAIGFLLKYTKPEISKTPRKGESAWPALTGPIKRYGEKQKEAAINWAKAQKEAAKKPFEQSYDAADLLPFFGETCTMEQLYYEFLDKFDVGILICELLKCLGVWPIDISLDLKLQLPKLPKLPSFDLLAGLRKMSVELLKKMLIRMLCSIARKIIELLKFTDCRERPPDDFAKAKELMDELLGPNASNKAQAMYDTLIDLNVPDDQLAEAADMVDDLSLMLSVSELCSLFRGNPSDSTLQLVQNYIRSKFSGTLADSLSDKEFITKFFAKLGFISGTSICDELESLIGQAPQMDKPLSECPCLDLEPLRKKLEESEISPQQVQHALDLAQAEREKEIESLKKLATGEFLEDAMPKYLMKLGDPDSAVSEMPAGLKHIGMAALKGIFEPTKRVFVDDTRLYRAGLHMQGTRIPTQEEELRAPGTNPIKTRQKFEAIERMLLLKEFLDNGGDPMNLAEEGNFVKFYAYSLLFAEFKEELGAPGTENPNAPNHPIPNGVLRFSQPGSSDMQPRLIVVDDEYLETINVKRDFENSNSYNFLINTPSFDIKTDGGTNKSVNADTVDIFKSVQSRLDEQDPLFVFLTALGNHPWLEERTTMHIFPSNVRDTLEGTDGDGDAVGLPIHIQDKITDVDSKFASAWSTAFTNRVKELTSQITEALTDPIATSSRSGTGATEEILLPNIREIFSEDIEIEREIEEFNSQERTFLQRDTFNARDSRGNNVVNKFKISLPDNFNRPNLGSAVQSPCEIHYDEYSTNEYFDQYKVKIKDPYFLEMKRTDFYKVISKCEPLYYPQDLNLAQVIDQPPEPIFDVKRHLFQRLLNTSLRDALDNPGSVGDLAHVIDDQFRNAIVNTTNNDRLRKALFELFAQDIKDTIHDSQFFSTSYIQDLTDRISSKIHYNLDESCVGNPCGKIDYGLLDFRAMLEDSMDVLANEFSSVTAFEQHDFAGPSAFDEAAKKVATQLLIKILIIEFVLRSGPTFGTFRAEYILENSLTKAFLLEFILHWEFQKNNTLNLIREDIFKAVRSITGVEDEVRALTLVIDKEIKKLIPKINTIFKPKSGSPTEALLSRAIANSYDYNPVSMLYERSPEPNPVLQAYDFVQTSDIVLNPNTLLNLGDDRFYIGRKLFVGRTGRDRNLAGFSDYGSSNMSIEELNGKGTFFLERYVRIGGPLLSVMRDYRKAELLATQIDAGIQRRNMSEDVREQEHLFHDAGQPGVGAETEVFTIRELKEAATGELTREMIESSSELGLSTSEDCFLQPLMTRAYPSRFIRLNRHHSTVDWRHIEHLQPLMEIANRADERDAVALTDCHRRNILVYAPHPQLEIWNRFGLVVRGPFRTSGETGRTRNLYDDIPLAEIINPYRVELWDEAHRWFAANRLGRPHHQHRDYIQGWFTYWSGNQGRIARLGNRDLHFVDMPGLYPHNVWFRNGQTLIGGPHICGTLSCGAPVSWWDKPQAFSTKLIDEPNWSAKGDGGSKQHSYEQLESIGGHLEGAAQTDAVEEILAARSRAGLFEGPSSFRLKSSFLDNDDPDISFMNYLGFPWTPQFQDFDRRHTRGPDHRPDKQLSFTGWDEQRYFVVSTDLCPRGDDMDNHMPDLAAGIGAGQDLWSQEFDRVKQGQSSYYDENYGYKFKPLKALEGIAPSWYASTLEQTPFSEVIEYKPDEEYQNHERVTHPERQKTLYRGVTNAISSLTDPDTELPIYESEHPLSNAVFRNFQVGDINREFEALKMSRFYPGERGNPQDMDKVLLGEVDEQTYLTTKNDIYENVQAHNAAAQELRDSVSSQAQMQEEVWTQYVIDFVGVAAPIFSEPGESYHSPDIMPYLRNYDQHSIDAAHATLKKWHHDDNEDFNIGQAWAPRTQEWVDYYPVFPFGRLSSQNTLDIGWNYNGMYPRGRAATLGEASYKNIRFEGQNGGRHDYYKIGHEDSENTRRFKYDSFIGNSHELGVDFYDENYFQTENTSISEKNFIFTTRNNHPGQYNTVMNRPLGRTSNPFRYEDKWPEIGGYFCDGKLTSLDAKVVAPDAIHWQLPETVAFAKIKNPDGLEDEVAQYWYGEGRNHAARDSGLMMSPESSRFFVEKNKFLVHRANEYRVPIRMLITKIEYRGATQTPSEVYIDYVLPEVFEPHPDEHGYDELVKGRQRELLQSSVEVLVNKYANYARQVSMQATEADGLLVPGRVNAEKEESLYGYGSAYHLGAEYIWTVNPGFGPQRNIVLTNAYTDNVQPSTFTNYAFSSKAYYGPDARMWDGSKRSEKGNTVLPFTTTARIYSQAADIEVYRDYTNEVLDTKLPYSYFTTNQESRFEYSYPAPRTAHRFSKDRRHIDALFLRYTGYKVKSAPNNAPLENGVIPDFGDFLLDTIVDADRDASVNTGLQESLRKFPGFIDVFSNNTIGVPIRLNDTAIPNKQEFQDDKLISSLEIRRLVEWVKATWISDRTWEGFWGRTCSSDFAKGLVQQDSVMTDEQTWDHTAQNDWYLYGTNNTIYTRQDGHRFLPSQRPVERSRNFYWSPLGPLDEKLPGTQELPGHLDALENPLYHIPKGTGLAGSGRPAATWTSFFGNRNSEYYSPFVLDGKSLNSERAANAGSEIIQAENAMSTNISSGGRNYTQVINGIPEKYAPADSATKSIKLFNHTNASKNLYAELSGYIQGQPMDREISFQNNSVPGKMNWLVANYIHTMFRFYSDLSAGQNSLSVALRNLIESVGDEATMAQNFLVALRDSSISFGTRIMYATDSFTFSEFVADLSPEQFKLIENMSIRERAFLTRLYAPFSNANPRFHDDPIEPYESLEQMVADQDNPIRKQQFSVNSLIFPVAHFEEDVPCSDLIPVHAEQLFARYQDRLMNGLIGSSSYKFLSKNLFPLDRMLALYAMQASFAVSSMPRLQNYLRPTKYSLSTIIGMAGKRQELDGIPYVKPFGNPFQQDVGMPLGQADFAALFANVGSSGPQNVCGGLPGFPWQEILIMLIEYILMLVPSIIRAIAMFLDPAYKEMHQHFMTCSPDKNHVGSMTWEHATLSSENFAFTGQKGQHSQGGPQYPDNPFVPAMNKGVVHGNKFGGEYATILGAPIDLAKSVTPFFPYLDYVKFGRVMTKIANYVLGAAGPFGLGGGGGFALPPCADNKAADGAGDLSPDIIDPDKRYGHLLGPFGMLALAMPELPGEKRDEQFKICEIVKEMAPVGVRDPNSDNVPYLQPCVGEDSCPEE